MKAVLLYATTDRLGQVIGWGSGLLTAGLILRLIHDFLAAYNSPEFEGGFKEAVKKSKNRLYAVLIALTVDSLVAFFQMFY